jgi:cell wall-associated NlpC family hydrolase
MTPFHSHAAIKGAGVDCSHLIAAVFNVALGLHLSIAEHNDQWFLAKKKEDVTDADQLYLRELEAQGFIEIPKEKVQIGDLVISHTDYAYYCHGGVIVNWPTPPSRPSVVHVTVKGSERVHDMYSSWYYARQPDELKFYSWGAWHF